MRGLVVLVICGLLACGAAVYLIGRVTADQGFPIGVAFGNPKDDQIEIHVVVNMGMPRRDQPRVNLKSSTVLWDEWIAKHFILTDGSGPDVAFTQHSHSTLISDQKAVGTPEFYLAGKVKSGVAYTFDYIPRLATGNRYRYRFTAPASDTPVRRLTFSPQ